MLRMKLLLTAFLVLLNFCKGEKPTLYQYYIGDNGDQGITSGLVANANRSFTLNGKDFRIISGSLHYFRVHPSYWRDRLTKFRAAGLNAVDVYVPWNLHQPRKGHTDFGDGGYDLSAFLDLRGFLTLCKEHDLFVIFRPGPYICGEFEFGGLPSWLLATHPMNVRTSGPEYEGPALSYLKEVIDRVKDLQFHTTRNGVGGPIIAVQIENEYGAFGYGNYPRDKPHLNHIRNALHEAGIESLLIDSDGVQKDRDYGHIEGVLLTSNFGAKPTDVDKNLNELLSLQPDKPVFVTEFWTGWFDHWLVPFKSDRSLEDFTASLEKVMGTKYNASVNFYMFHGGTNFGFLNGGNAIDVFPWDAFDVTSYDYGAPLSECGNYTDKYNSVIDMVEKYDPLSQIVAKPDPPTFVDPVAYQQVVFDEYLTYDEIISNSETRCTYDDLRPMEMFDCLNDGNGQSYGYAVYRKEVVGLKTGDKLKVKGRVHDLLIVMVNGVMVNQEPIVNIFGTLGFGSWGLSDAELTLDLSNVPNNNDQVYVLDLWVENLGRINYGKPHVLNAQRKGLWEGPVYINDQKLVDEWTIIPLEFKSDWIKSLSGWQPLGESQMSIGQATSPMMLKGEFSVSEDPPKDTFLDLTDWLHGIVFVNGFNLGRYFKGGPQKSLYVPGPLLKEGLNEIVVVESYQSQKGSLKFSNKPLYAPTHYLIEENFEKPFEDAFDENHEMLSCET